MFKEARLFQNSWGGFLLRKKRPKPFDELDGLFWADPYISSHVVFSHLDSTTDDASRPLAQIARESAWLDQIARIDAKNPGRALDLGCGPGLYASELARRGWQVTGVDISPSSIKFAQQEAQDEGLKISFIQANLHEFCFPSDLDLIFLTYGTLGTFSPEQVQKLVNQCFWALKPGGMFVFDTFDLHWWKTEQRRFNPQSLRKDDGPGFWSPLPHLVLNRRYVYPRLRTFARVWTVIEPERSRQFAFWYRWYNRQHLQSLFHQGWNVQFFASLETSSQDTHWITTIARKE